MWLMEKSINIYILIAIILLIFPYITYGEDYQYQYFNEEKDKFVPFSDYIPKVRLHYKTVPHYLEDYYELYCMKQYYNENSLRKNIERLKTALKCKFRHPSQALVKMESNAEYNKYRNLLFMHLNMLIMRNYMRVASKYDKQKIYFYNIDFANEIKDSLDIAENLYKEAIPYWEKAKEYAEKASSYKLTTDLGYIESERYSIVKNELDFGRIIDKYIEKIGKKRLILGKSLSSKSR